MSLRAHLWAMDNAPVKNPTAALILLALADEANDDGEGACPYMDKLVQRGRCSERSAQEHLRALFRARLINLGDPGVALRRYKKSAGRAPRVWDLNMSATWTSMPEPRSDEEMREYSAMIGQRPVRRSADKGTEQGSDQEQQRGVQDLHPSEGADERGVQNLHPSDETGSDQAVQPAVDGEDQCEGCGHSHPRGAACRTPGVQPTAPFLSVPALTRSSPPPSTSLTDGDHSSSKEEGEGDSKNREPVLTEIVGWFTRLRPDWRSETVTEVLTAAVGQGLGDLRTAATALHELAEGRHGETFSPRRLLIADGPWWVSSRPKRSPARTKLAAAPRCSKKGHERQEADGCGLCQAEVNACPDCEAGARSCSHDPDADREISEEAAERAAQFLANRQRNRAATTTATTAGNVA